jgi:hypothetical protein
MPYWELNPDPLIVTDPGRDWVKNTCGAMEAMALSPCTCDEPW